MPSTPIFNIEIKKIIFLLLFVLYIGGCGDDNVKDNQSTMHPGQIKDVSFTQVHLNDAFWAPRMEINRTVSIPSAFYQCEINGRFDNFALAGGLIDCEHQGDFSFDDTDPYKIIEAAEYAILHPQPTMASQAEQVGGWGFNDQMEPKSSSDLNTPYYYWWLKNGSEESIGYRFDEPKEISAVEVYWLAFEHYDVIYKVPEYWKLYYKEADSDSWKEVENASEYTVEKDQYNKVTFNPVVTTDLKLVAKLQGPDDNPEINNDNKLQVPDIGKNGYSGGVIEWKVY